MIKHLVGIFILLLIFVPLERLFTLKKEQKIFRNGWRTDLIHLLVNKFLVNVGVIVVAVLLAVALRGFISPSFQAAVASQTFALQFLEAVFIADISAYFAHRLLHEVPFLWRFHSVHHSSEQLDWLAAARVHPFDSAFIRAFQFVPLYIFGFSKETFGAYLVVATFQAIFLHANVRLRFPVLRWFVATPEFHHWHHSNDGEARNKNFAGQFPWIDQLFGTLHLPKNKMPETYGIDAQMPASYPAQILYPFQKEKTVN